MNLRTALVLTLLAIALPLSAPPAQASDDGSFCVAKGYLAFNLQSEASPGINKHVLRVVRFDSKRGIYQAGEVELQSFHVHWITCSEDRVEISGWGLHFTKYVVDISGPEGLRILDHTEDPERKFDPKTDPPDSFNLGYEQPGTFPLESFDPGHKYQLNFSRSQRFVEGGVQHHRKAELLQFDLLGTISQRLVIYDTQFLETID